MKRIAVIVIGSNSTRMLATDCCDALTNAVRGRVETRLFLGMSDSGMLSEEAIAYTAQSVAQLKKDAEATGAALLGVYATSASRDAKNSDALSSAIKNSTGHALQIISGEEEAAYSFFGAAGAEKCGVIDIGGGSSEVVLGQGLQISCAHSLQLGASRLFKMQPINCCADIEKALAIAKETIGTLPKELLKHTQTDLFYLIGGTGTSCARIARWQPEGCVITRTMVANMLTVIADTPRKRRARIPGFPPSRIDILPAGMVILLALFDALHIEKVHVTERVNADGLLRAFVHKKFA